MESRRYLRHALRSYFITSPRPAPVSLCFTLQPVAVSLQALGLPVTAARPLPPVPPPPRGVTEGPGVFRPPERGHGVLCRVCGAFFCVAAVLFKGRAVRIPASPGYKYTPSS